MDNAKAFLDVIWGIGGSHCLSYGDSPNRVFWGDAEACEKFIKDKTKQFNFWFSPATFNNDTSLKSNNVKYSQSLWLDVDFKDFGSEPITKKVTDILDFLSSTEFKFPNIIVESGNGLHLYWLLDDAVNRDRWLPLANKLKETINPIAKYVDGTRTGDIASRMRLPFTYNLKDKANPKATKVIHCNLDTAINTIAMLNGYREKQSEETKTESLSINYPKSNPLLLAKRCAFIKAFAETGFPNSEPAWHAAIGVVSFCDDGARYCHEWSAKASNYDKNETDKKLENVNDKPFTCAYLQQFSFCDGCPFNDTITTPLQSAVDIKPIENTKELVNGHDFLNRDRAIACMDRVPNDTWIVSSFGIYKKIDDDGRALVCDVALYIVDLICEDYNDSSIVTAIVLAVRDNYKFTFNLPLKVLADSKKFMSELYGRKIFPFDKKLLLAYFCQYVKNLDLANIKPHKVAIALGWQKDGSFLYTSSGLALKNEENKVFVFDRRVKNFVEGYKSKGSLDVWPKIFNTFLNDKAYLPHLFSIMCSIGSPLLYFTAAKGLVVSLQGPTGTGKTLGHLVAASVWGDPMTAGVLGVHDTHNAMIGRLATVKHLPLRLDEATQLKPQQLCGLIFELVNGRGRARATLDGSLAHQSSDWQTLTLITTNRPLLELDIQVLTEAERMRILEFPVTTPQNIYKDGNKIGRLIQDNYGLLGIEFIKKFIANKQENIKQLDDLYLKLLEQLDGTKRFWASGVAVGLMAAKFCDELFNMNSHGLIHDWVVTFLQQQTLYNEQQIIESRGFKTKDEFVNALYDWLHGSIMDYDDNGNEMPMNIRGEIKARMIKTGDSHMLFVRPPVLKDFIRKYYTEGVQHVIKTFEIGSSIVKAFAGKNIRGYNFEIEKKK